MNIQNNLWIFYTKILKKRKNSLYYKVWWFVLLILSWLYEFADTLNRFIKTKIMNPKRIESVFLISVGGITIGGAGKTPFVYHLVQKLRLKGYKMAISSRGYNRKSNTIEIIDSNSSENDIKLTGDEPLMLHKNLPDIPIVIGTNRYKAIKHLINKYTNIDLIILDDSFQHYQLKKNIDIVLLPYSVYKEKNEKIFPAGKLRENLTTAQKRLDYLIITKYHSNKQIDSSSNLIFTSIKSDYLIDIKKNTRINKNIITDKNIVIISAIANNKEFTDTILQLNPQKYKIFEFIDHYDYNNLPSSIIEAINNFKPDFIVTTEKDAVKLINFDLDFPILALHIELVFLNNEEYFFQELEKKYKEWKNRRKLNA